MMLIDGSAGEGGGQVLRTCLSLSALTGQPIRLTNIRANRSRPGLRPQHLTAVRATAVICQAQLSGATLNSESLEFVPQDKPRGGIYTFDVNDAAQGGSAGSITLILQTLLWPLLFAQEPSTISLRGGTHVPYSPSYHYLAHVARPAFLRLGASFSLELPAWGWYPQGGGKIVAEVQPVGSLQPVNFAEPLPTTISGIAAVTNLPAHIPQRMAGRASNLLTGLGLKPDIKAIREQGIGPGAGIFLWVPLAGFSALGRKGVPAERVAESAVDQCRTFKDNKAGVGKYLADQLLLPLALAHGCSSFKTSELTAHTLTIVQLLQQWLKITIDVSGAIGEPGHITVTGMAYDVP
jgi:RNA 3'-terminal phosphate cyclase (ATP)